MRLFFKKILQKLSIKNENYNSLINNQIKIISLYYLIGIVFSLFLGIFLISSGDFTHSIFFFLLFAFQLVAYFYLKKSKKYPINSYLALVFYLAFNSILFLCNEFMFAGLFWALVFPLLALFIFGFKKGGGISLIMLVLFSGLLFLNLDIFSSFTFSVKLLFIVAYLVLFSVSYVYEYFSQQNFDTTQKAMLDAKLAIKEKNEFISKLSHQIRTPLNNIIGVADIFVNTGLTDKQLDLISTIHASANNLVTAVNNINQASDIKTDYSNNTIEFNLKYTVESTVELFSAGNKQHLKLTIDDNIPEKLIGNPVLLKQIFLNLIELFMQDTTQKSLNINILIKLEKIESDTVICCFIFEGNLSKKLKNIHKSSFKESSDYKFLDLLITQRLIEDTGSRLILEQKEQNTRLKFLMSFKNLQMKLKNSKIKEETLTETLTKNKIELDEANVLLVEDNLINQKIMVLSLKKIVKNVDIAENGKIALDKFGNTKYDLLLMDVQMPVMDGIKATQKIREIEFGTNTHVPIIAITANALMGDREECLKAGMDDYISKPFKMEILIDKMKHYLSN